MPVELPGRVQHVNRKMSDTLDRIADGRTDLVFDYLSEGHAANSKDEHGLL
jgi:hypothetical protein